MEATISEETKKKIFLDWHRWVTPRRMVKRYGLTIEQIKAIVRDELKKQEESKTGE